jgi:hypothetical protein
MGLQRKGEIKEAPENLLGLKIYLINFYFLE